MLEWKYVIMIRISMLSRYAQYIGEKSWEHIFKWKYKTILPWPATAFVNGGLISILKYSALSYFYPFKLQVQEECYNQSKLSQFRYAPRDTFHTKYDENLEVSQLSYMQSVSKNDYSEIASPMNIKPILP